MLCFNKKILLEINEIFKEIHSYFKIKYTDEVFMFFYVYNILTVFILSIGDCHHKW